MTLDTILQVLSDQMNMLRIFLERPIVQRQLIALVVIFFLTWAATELVRRWVTQANDKYPLFKHPFVIRWRRWFVAFYTLIAPIMGIALTQLIISGVEYTGYSAGILIESLNLFGTWLIYRIIIAFFYTKFGQTFYPYHRWIFLPMFVGILIYQTMENLVGIRLLAQLAVLNLSGSDITIGGIITAMVILYIFVILAWIIQETLQRALRLQAESDPGLVNTVTIITRYTVIAIGTLFTLYALGLDLSTIAIVGGGLSIGVGFGLQQIIANFISGIVLLFEQSLRPGDIIDINGEFGTVEKLNIRSTTIRTLNNVEIIVPNEAFLTQQVTTYTKSDKKFRLQIPFGVSYDCHPQLIRKLVLETVVNHGKILKHPAPNVLFMGFGDSSIDFNVTVWIDQPEANNIIKSDIYFMLWSAFEDHNIEIPYPQRDLNIRRGWSNLIPSAEEKTVT